MSRFGSTAEIIWNSGDTFIGGENIFFNESDMPQYPFEEARDSDVVEYRSLSGNIYQYQNYNKVTYNFNWSNLSESYKTSLSNMADALPIFNFASGGNDFGTFRIVPGSFNASEIMFELYDVSFTAEEA